MAQLLPLNCHLNWLDDLKSNKAEKAEIIPALKRCFICESSLLETSTKKSLLLAHKPIQVEEENINFWWCLVPRRTLSTVFRNNANCSTYFRNIYYMNITIFIFKCFQQYLPCMEKCFHFLYHIIRFFIFLYIMAHMIIQYSINSDKIRVMMGYSSSLYE